jgi:hypothetical protein
MRYMPRNIPAGMTGFFECGCEVESTDEVECEVYSDGTIGWEKRRMFKLIDPCGTPACICEDRELRNREVWLDFWAPEPEIDTDALIALLKRQVAES